MERSIKEKMGFVTEEKLVQKNLLMLNQRRLKRVFLGVHS
ncbi:MAG: hypothetical protein CM15mP56_4980 [Alphaproteobacteria bacterium]|nr:MAG: hypothetical protein CM15mP56_4980 [Alphaproteobacteria bacterium]